jgi:hypothetical protein
MAAEATQLIPIDGPEADARGEANGAGADAASGSSAAPPPAPPSPRPSALKPSSLEGALSARVGSTMRRTVSWCDLEGGELQEVRLYSPKDPPAAPEAPEDEFVTAGSGGGCCAVM